MSRCLRAVLPVAILVATGCTLRSSRESPKPAANQDLSLAEFEARVEAGRTWIVDARPRLFYQFGHVPGAISLPRDDFESAYAALRARLEKDRRRPIAVYCFDRTCEDSSTIRLALMKLGYAEVAVFHGGWVAWTAAHLPEEKAPE